MGPAKEISGGSAANTLAGMAALGAKCAFVGQVADDQLGEVFTHDIRAIGVDYETPSRPAEGSEDSLPTARCLIFVTPDGERTMNTFLGATQFLPAEALDDDLIASAGILYLEGYLWDPEEPRRAMRRAIEVARKAGRKVAFTASESFVIDRHGDDFRALIDEGQIDILFVNETELATLTGEADFDAGLASLSGKIPTVVATRSRRAGRNPRGSPRRTGRQGGRHHGCGRPVRGGLPHRPCAWRGPRNLPHHGRGLCGGNYLALRRAQRSGSESAGDEAAGMISLSQTSIGDLSP